MPIYVAPKEQPFGFIRTVVGNLVRNFDADPSNSRKRIRDLLARDPEGFYASSLAVLKAADNSRGVQYVVSLLLANGMLLKALCDPQVSRHEALTIGRAAVQADPMSDVTLARDLADPATGSAKAEPACLARAMDILSEIADAARIIPPLMRMMRHPNARLRSKAVKMIGRGNRSTKWVSGRLNDPDPRVRANAVESLWGVDTPESRALLNAAVKDNDNRVAGNAMLGLYYLGEPSVLAEIVKMAAHESARFRSSAAWVMGETGDSRFTEALRHLIAEPEVTVRKRAFAALVRIKAAQGHPPSAAPESTVAAAAEQPPPGGSRAS